MNVLAIIVIAILLGILGFIYWIALDTYIVKIKKNEIMEFKTSMELSGLPIITFYQGNKAYNFLLDTGSNVSYVNIKSDIKIFDTGEKNVFMGSSGEDKPCIVVQLVLYRNEIKYEHTVHAADLNLAFTEVKKEYGITITGILGNDFFTKYKYCLDFKELVAYQR